MQKSNDGTGHPWHLLKEIVVNESICLNVEH